MSNESDSKSSFVVKDRRRFDMEGNEKSDQSAAERPEAGSSETAKRETVKHPAHEKATEGARQHTTAGPRAQQATVPPGTGDFVTKPAPDDHDAFDFSSFIISLATQALMQLGAMQPPSGVSVPIDKEAAKQTIDILTMLHHKTRGNLERDEDRLLQEILHNVRLSYVRAMQ